MNGVVANSEDDVCILQLGKPTSSKLIEFPETVANSQNEEKQ